MADPTASVWDQFPDATADQQKWIDPAVNQKIAIQQSRPAAPSLPVVFGSDGEPVNNSTTAPAPTAPADATKPASVWDQFPDATPEQTKWIDPATAHKLNVQQPAQQGDQPWSLGSLGENAVAGAARSGWDALAAPANLANAAVNLGIRGVNAVAGTSIPQFSTDVGGDVSRGVAGATGGWSPYDVQPQNTAERIAAGVGALPGQLVGMGLGGAGMEAAAPFMAGVAPETAALTKGVGQSLREQPIVRNLAPSSAGVATGQVAEDVSPDWAKPYASLAGNLLGAGVGAGIQEGAVPAAKFAASIPGRAGIGAKTQYGDVAATGAQADAVGNRLWAAGGDQLLQKLQETGAAESRLKEIDTQLQDPATPPVDIAALQAERLQLAPQTRSLGIGAQPTVGQLAYQPAVNGLEQAARVADKDPFVARDIAQNSGRLQTISGQATEGADTAPIGKLFTDGLDALEAQRDTAVGSAGAARETAGGSSMGGLGRPEDYGAAMHQTLTDARVPAKMQASKLYDMVDPDKTLALNVTPVRDAGADILKSASAVGGVDVGTELHPGVAQMAAVAARLPDVAPFAALQQLRTNIGGIAREIGGNPQLGRESVPMRQIMSLKSAVDNSIQDAVERATASGDGALKQRLADELGSVKDTTRANVGEAVGGGAGGSSAVAGGDAGTANAQQGGLGGGSGNPGVAGNAGFKPSSKVTASPSLGSFLISKGGVREESGELGALDARRARPGLVNNKSGMSHDYAREAAEEAGYLKPDSTVTDFRNALSEELAGRKVYPIGKQAEMDMASRDNRDDLRSEAAYNDARNGVLQAEEESGERMSPAEIEHATHMTMRGAHPAEALREAARSTEEAILQDHARRQAFGLPGVPPGAEQSSLPGTPQKPALQENMTAEGASALKRANANYQDYKSTFSQGPVGKVLATDAFGARKIADLSVPGQFFRKGDINPDAVAAYIKASGGRDTALATARDYLVSELRHDGIVDASTGAVNDKKLDAWVQQRGPALDALGGGLRAKLDTAAAAQKTYDATVAEHEDWLKEYQNGVAKEFLKGDPVAAVNKTLSAGDPAGFGRIVSAVSHNPDAVDAAKRIVVDWLGQHMRGAGAANEQENFLKSNEFRKWVAKFNDPTRGAPLEKLFGKQGAQNFEMVAEDLRRQTQRTQATAGSGTADKGAAAAKHGMGGHSGSIMSYLMGEGVGTLGGHLLGHGEAGGVIGAALGTVVNALRQKGIDTTNALIREALLNPDLAQTLMQRMPQHRMTDMIKRQIASRLQASMLVNTTSNRRH